MAEPGERREPARAVWFPRPRHVAVLDEPARFPGPDEILVRSIVSGVSAGSELLVFRGEVPPGMAPDLPTVGGDFGFPVKFGYASVGRVAEAGAGVRATQHRPGDLVFVHHPHQTEFVVHTDAAIRLPAGVPPERAVLTANLETALTVVLDANPRLGEVALVTGQGIVGLLVTMLLRRAGAGAIVTVDRHAGRREASLRAGADTAVGPGDDVGAAVLARSGGRGADVAIEASGDPRALQACLDAAAFSGTVVAASWYGTRPATLDLGGAFHRKRLSLVGSQVSTLDPALTGRWDRARRMDQVRGLLCDLPLDGLVTHRFPIREAAAAYDMLERHPEECLQVVLVHDDAREGSDHG